VKTLFALSILTLTLLAGCTNNADKNAAAWNELNSRVQLETDCANLETQMLKEHRSEHYMDRQLRKSGCDAK
jgi:outer membrane murein-binding lipoprotein Lpp